MRTDFMDYEKEYNYLVAKLKGAYSSDEYKGKHFCCVMNSIAPEIVMSVEDRIRRGLIEFVQEYGDKFYSQAAKGSAIAYLEKQGEQKPVWSEADEEELGLATATLTDVGQSSSAHWVEELSERFKSARPPYYCDTCKLKKSVEGWKPSEEQMDALLWVIENTSKSIDANIWLNSLYEQLKSLQNG